MSHLSVHVQVLRNLQRLAYVRVHIIRASLSEPHIDELKFIMVRTSPARRSTHYYSYSRMNKSMRAAA